MSCRLDSLGILSHNVIVYILNATRAAYVLV